MRIYYLFIFFFFFVYLWKGSFTFQTAFFRHKSWEPLLLELKGGSVSFEVGLSIPVVALYLSSINLFSVHCVYTCFCIFLFYEFDLNNSIWVGLIKSDSFYLPYLSYFLWYLLFHILQVLIIVGFLYIYDVLENDNFESLSLIFKVVIPRKLLLFHHFSLNFLGETLLFHFPRFIVLLFLWKLCFFNGDFKATSDFFII